jgi:hypothetical protein
MKRVYLSLSFILTIAITSANAGEGGTVSKEVQSAFNKVFPAAEGLNWNVAGDFLRATFILDGHRTLAYFDEDGRFAGSLRSLFFNQLPLASMSAIDKKYPGADILEVYEITNDEGTSYLLLLEATQKKYKVKVDANGNITQSDRVKK